MINNNGERRDEARMSRPRQVLMRDDHLGGYESEMEMERSG